MGDEHIEQCFQAACNRYVAERRLGRDGGVFFVAANAIEDAWPKVIEAYRNRIGVWSEQTPNVQADGKAGA